MEGIVINTMSKAKKIKSVSNLRAHSAQVGKASGNKDDEYKKYNIKFKNVKVLSAKVHCNEVYYPRFKEIENEDGTTKLRRLSKKERIESAYVKVHTHMDMDYFPLVSAEKNGIKIKLMRNRRIIFKCIMILKMQ